ncbi:MarR family winged helix-turn-helix transcriptional regulator [Acidiphilium iwatense]|uniref:MarR family transcriptional regulator n=2 Tax=Acidiphilium TaxID=522 RepID=A0ABS9E008_9PROT|nr:MarR family transcriptional regulator [Acidiphilium iwatense]MCF3947246.1 MarR family transcriptional regulator [Acidiphilium iwatense]
MTLSDHDYRTLAEFRYALRRFLSLSETAARSAGLTPRQHQALLAIKGADGAAPIGLGDLAERLALHHNSMVELADRLADSGLVSRIPDSTDRRRVRLALTPAGEEKLAALSAIHLEELRRMRPVLQRLIDRLT